MTEKTITLEITFSDQTLDELQTAFRKIDQDGLYDGKFDDFLYDLANFHIVKHMRENEQLFLDLQSHFTTWEYQT